MATAKKTSAAKARVPAKKVAKRVPSVSPLRGRTTDWYIGTMQGWQRALATEIAAAFAKAAPKSTSSIKWGQVVWELGGPFAFMKGNKAHITVGFWRGAELDDAGGLLEGDGDRMRHLKLRESEKLPARAIAAFVKQAVALNAAKGDPTKR
jgi:hypothetical protein